MLWLCSPAALEESDVRPVMLADLSEGERRARFPCLFSVPVLRRFQIHGIVTGAPRASPANVPLEVMDYVERTLKAHGVNPGVAHGPEQAEAVASAFSAFVSDAWDLRAGLRRPEEPPPKHKKTRKRTGHVRTKRGRRAPRGGASAAEA